MRKGAAMSHEHAGQASEVRVGAATSRSLKYARVVNTPDEIPAEPGQTLVTTSHEVIQRWAQARDAQAATVLGTEHGDTLGVLTFDFPPHGDNPNLRLVSWDDWFATFDRRKVTFLFEDKLADGRQSNFVRLENPEREDA
jgi:hypothetical protein